jgi:SpoVK/Ycf46/Vps4 family AAA+-type ATPase
VAFILGRLCLGRRGKRGIMGMSIDSCADVMDILSTPEDTEIEVVRALSKYGRLFQCNLISLDDPDADPSRQSIAIDPMLVESFMGKVADDAWAVATERELYDKLETLIRLFARKVWVMERLADGDGNARDFYCVGRRIEHFRCRLKRTLEQHPQWGLSRLLSSEEVESVHAQDMLLALLGKELGYLRSKNDLFKGENLARAASSKAGETRRHLELLRSGSVLIKERYVRPCGGHDMLLSDDPEDIASAEFALGEKSLDILQRQRNCVCAARRGMREPKVSFDQLVLSDKVCKALRMAIAQARNAETLITRWGLGELVPYGRAVTLLFSGPPGTGKTASAEALAHELGRPILIANYAEIQNCWVGETEKNTNQVFAEAMSAGAVLFWDEADAMFYDRDVAFRTWEVRNVNVLLQQLERFEGVCILATNRKCSLDKALERRISLKVEFEPPDRGMRREIWARLVPARMPLADDVDLERLAEPELTGGEIKNVVLNAARIALTRGENTRLTMADFIAALEMETDGKWSAGSRSRVGFVQRAGQ